MKALMSQPAPRPDLSVTMRFDPQDGIPDLDAHLEDLRSQAEEAGFKFDITRRGTSFRPLHSGSEPRRRPG